MEVSELWKQAAFGAGGGVGAELLHWYMLARRSTAEAKSFAAGGLYWTTTLAMIALGSLMPILYLEGTASALLCFHLGAATPILLQKLVSTMPEVSRTQGRPGSTSDWQPLLRRFLDW